MAQLWSCGQSSGWRREAIMRWGETVRLFLVYRLTASQARSVPRDVWCVCAVGTPPCEGESRWSWCEYHLSWDTADWELAREWVCNVRTRKENQFGGVSPLEVWCTSIRWGNCDRHSVVFTSGKRGSIVTSLQRKDAFRGVQRKEIQQPLLFSRKTVSKTNCTKCALTLRVCLKK